MSLMNQLFVGNVEDSNQVVQEQRGTYLSLLEEEKDRPFSCTICGKRFRQACHLQQHIRTHTNERPYPCQFCEKKFKQKSQVNQHERIHTGEKPYECPICQKAFPQAGQLYSHKKSHGINPKVGKNYGKIPKLTRKRKQKCEQPIVVSPSPIVYLMESFAGSPEQGPLYNHEFYQADAGLKPSKTTGKLALQQKGTDARVFTQQRNDDCNGNVDSSILVKQPQRQMQSDYMPSSDSSNELRHVREEFRSLKTIPPHLRDFERLIPN